MQQNPYRIGLGVLVALVALVAIVVVIVVNLTHRPSAPELPRTSPEAQRSLAEQVLANRLARGEIDADEYRHFERRIPLSSRSQYLGSRLVCLEPCRHSIK